MAKDYYLILGVRDDASLDEIKSAYRREAKRRHPDCSGEGCEPFLDLQEAYEVLGDPGRRQAYDDRRAREERRRQSESRSRPEPIRRRPPPTEPLVPERRSRGSGPAFESTLSSLMAELLGQTRRAPGRRWVASGAEEVHLDVLVSREEARYGGRVRAWIPVQAPCPACGGHGGTYFFACQHCLGEGAIVQERPVDILFPGDLADGLEGRVSLRRPGMRDLSLVLHFRVDPR